VAAKYAALQTRPAGIVFHTTESDLVPFDPSQNANLKRLAHDIVTYVRRHKAYHYLVDRFGRVHRVVEESSIANHAGHSIWGDADHLYVNLNNSFFGVAFEAQTRPQDGTETINQAQMHAGRVLTDMLRSKYGIAAEDCITHSQVSVNPDNFRIGAHTDWATRFPYAEMGLPDNYAIPVPSITGFGFSYDNSFVNASEARLWKGLLIAQEELRQAAKAQGVTLISYRAALHRRYKEIIEAWKTPPKQESL
jgi:N-acetylmuramoyl-L-alanine amidase